MKEQTARSTWTLVPRVWVSPPYLFHLSFCVPCARMMPLLAVQCWPVRARKDALTAGDRRFLHPFSAPSLPRSWTRSLTAGCNAATWYCLGPCASFTASGLLCGRNVWLQERCQWSCVFLLGSHHSAWWLCGAARAVGGR
ncbi:hypothetical protein TcCL_Unassigned03393 [Trypanosoma cruzi]|nr:hypothetical protein TcCL_Unassigned03393 [Trypanosoma cruzi]